MSKVLVVSYSYTGTSRKLAQLLCRQQNWPLGEISEHYSREGLRGLWDCLADSWLRRTPTIRYAGSATANFDAVVLVSPVWALRLAGPMRSFISARLGQFPDVAVIFVRGVRGGLGAVSKVAGILGRNPILSTAFNQRDVQDGNCAARLTAFASAVQWSPPLNQKSCHTENQRNIQMNVTRNETKPHALVGQSDDERCNFHSYPCP